MSTSHAGQDLGTLAAEAVRETIAYLNIKKAYVTSAAPSSPVPATWQSAAVYDAHIAHLQILLTNNDSSLLADTDNLSPAAERALQDLEDVYADFRRAAEQHPMHTWSLETAQHVIRYHQERALLYNPATIFPDEVESDGCTQETVHRVETAHDTTVASATASNGPHEELAHNLYIVYLISHKLVVLQTLLDAINFPHPGAGVAHHIVCEKLESTVAAMDAHIVAANTPEPQIRSRAELETNEAARGTSQARQALDEILAREAQWISEVNAHGPVIGADWTRLRDIVMDKAAWHDPTAQFEWIHLDAEEGEIGLL